MFYSDIWTGSTLISIGRLPVPERANLVMYFIGKLNEVKHEITKLSSRASSLVTPWNAVRLLLPPSWYKLANVSDRDVGHDTISDTFSARTLHHPCALKMEFCF